MKAEANHLTIAFFKPLLSHFVETMAYYLASDVSVKVRIITSLERGSEFSEHPWILERMRTRPEIELVSLEAAPLPCSLLVIGSTRQENQPPALAGWLTAAKTSAIYPEANLYNSRADWLRELIRSWRYFLGARFMILERESHPLDFRLCCPRRVHYTPTVHPQFLINPVRKAQMFGPVPAGKRRFRLTFLGNRQPPQRSLCLDSAWSALTASPQVTITKTYPSPLPEGLEVLWVEYDTAAGTRGLTPENYTVALDETDFVLSPPGWGRNWTHRTIETLVRGAIPVLEDPELYNLPLVDGENCVVARDGDWAEAVRRCLASTPPQIETMRAGALQLRETRLLPEIAARSFSKAFLAQCE